MNIQIEDAESHPDDNATKVKIRSDFDGEGIGYAMNFDIVIVTDETSTAAFDVRPADFFAMFTVGGGLTVAGLIAKLKSLGFSLPSGYGVMDTEPGQLVENILIALSKEFPFMSECTDTAVREAVVAELRS